MCHAPAQAGHPGPLARCQRPWIFEQAAARLGPRLRLVKVDTEAEPALASRFAIRSIPSLVLVRGGQEVARTAGAMPLDALVQWTERALAA